MAIAVEQNYMKYVEKVELYYGACVIHQMSYIRLLSIEEIIHGLESYVYIKLLVFSINFVSWCSFSSILKFPYEFSHQMLPFNLLGQTKVVVILRPIYKGCFHSISHENCSK